LEGAIPPLIDLVIRLSGLKPEEKALQDILGFDLLNRVLK